MNSKIEKAIKKGDLISYDKIFASYSKERQERIKSGARYIMARIELIKLRRKLKLSQDGLARKMKVKREFIARLESGKQNVTLDTLYRVAEATNKKFQFNFV
jgi:DNA-binding XRE family transcriptional regulator